MRRIYNEKGEFLREEESPFSEAAFKRAVARAKAQPEQAWVVKAEAELQAAARAEWLGVLVEMWDAIGKKADMQRLALYERNLAEVPLGLLQLAVKRAIRDNGGYQTVPTVGAVWTAVKTELKNPNDIDTALERWRTDQWRGINFFENWEPEPVSVETLEEVAYASQ